MILFGRHLFLIFKLKIEEERQPSPYGEILAQQGQLNRVP